MTKTLDNPNLKLVLESHAQWLNGTGGKCANLTGAKLIWADLTDDNLTGANLKDAVLLFAYLTNANLTRANLRNANLAKAHLTKANLTGADMASANLIWAYMVNVILTDATMTGANLTDAYGNSWTASGKATTWEGRYAASTVQATDGQRRLCYGCEGWRTLAEWKQDVASLCKRHVPDKAADYETKILDLLAKCRGMDN